MASGFLTGCPGETIEYAGEGGIFDSPVGVAINGGYAYVTNANFDLSHDSKGSITVIDIERSLINRKDCIVAEITTPPYIGKMVVSSDGTLGYLAHREKNEILILDLSDPAFPEIMDLDSEKDGNQGIPVGAEPFGLTLSPDESFLFVTNVGSGDLSIVDLEDRRLIKNEQIGWGINEIAIQPNSPYAYITNKGYLSVALVDINTHRYVTSFALGSYTSGIGSDTRGIDFTPDGKWAFIAARNPGSLMVVDTSKLPAHGDSAVVDLLPMDSSPTAVRVTPDGKEVWVSNFDSNNVYVLDTHSRAVLEVITVGDGPYDIAMAQAGDGREGHYWVFVSNFRSHNVSLIDSLSKEYVWVIP